VCRLGCVEFIYTSVSARCVVRFLEWQRIGNQIDAAFYLCAGGLRKRAVALEEPFGGAFEDDAMPADKTRGQL